MSTDDDTVAGPFGPISRRSAIGATLLAGAAFLAGHPVNAQEPRDAPASVPRKRYDMKKSINLWAFPYPQKMSLVQCLQLAKDAGFDGIEFSLFDPKSFPASAIRRELERVGLEGTALVEDRLRDHHLAKVVQRTAERQCPEPVIVPAHPHGDSCGEQGHAGAVRRR